MNAMQAVILAYAAIAVLLWGYAAMLMFGCRTARDTSDTASGRSPP